MRLNAMNEKFSRPKGRLFAALFRLRVQCIFFPTGEYTYSTLAKRRGEGGKGEDAAGILRRSRRKTVREAAFRLPYVRICAALPRGRRRFTREHTRCLLWVQLARSRFSPSARMKKYGGILSTNNAVFCQNLTDYLSADTL